MPKLPGSIVKDFDFKQLEESGKLDLIDYINTATILNRIPKAIKRIVTGLLLTNNYKIEGTKLVKNKS